MRNRNENKPMVMFFSPRVELRRSKKEHIHVEGFSNLVNNMVKLRREGTLTDDNFSELVKLASAAFIEAEISERVENVLQHKKLDDLLMSIWK